MRFLLDTNILLHYIRKSEIAQKVDVLYAPLASANEPFISVVSIGELESIALQNKWGEKKRKQLANLLNEVLVTDIYDRLRDALPLGPKRLLGQVGIGGLEEIVALLRVAIVRAIGSEEVLRDRFEVSAVPTARLRGYASRTRATK